MENPPVISSGGVVESKTEGNKQMNKSKSIIKTGQCCVLENVRQVEKASGKQARHMAEYSPAAGAGSRTNLCQTCTLQSFLMIISAAALLTERLMNDS